MIVKATNLFCDFVECLIEPNMQDGRFKTIQIESLFMRVGTVDALDYIFAYMLEVL